jgi:hypothetical protein
VTGTVPGLGATAPSPAPAVFATSIVMTKDEVFELCDVLHRAERALGSRGYTALAGRVGGWVAVLEHRLAIPVPARGTKAGRR